MVLRPRGRGRVGHRRHLIHRALVGYPAGALCVAYVRVNGPTSTKRTTVSFAHVDHATRWHRHRRRETQRRKVDDAQPHGWAKAQYYEPEAPVDARSDRGDPDHRQQPNGPPRHTGASRAEVSVAGGHAVDGA